VSLAQVQRDLQDVGSTLPGGKVEPKDGKVTGKDGRTRTATPKKPEREPGGDDDEETQTTEQPAELLDQAEQPIPPQACEAFNQMPVATLPKRDQQGRN
jgi:hypothetical protein